MQSTNEFEGNFTPCDTLRSSSRVYRRTVKACRSFTDGLSSNNSNPVSCSRPPPYMSKLCDTIAKGKEFEAVKILQRMRNQAGANSARNAETINNKRMEFNKRMQAAHDAKLMKTCGQDNKS